MLLPGDVVVIPARQQQRQACAIDRRHRFTLRAASETLRIRLLDALDRPRKNIDYEFVIEGESRTGSTDGDGELQEKIPLHASSARLVVGPEKREVELRLGHLDPDDAVTGWQARLSNVGLDAGPVDGIAGPRSRAALRAFQAEWGLEVTGEMNDATRSKLREWHGR